MSIVTSLAMRVAENDLHSARLMLEAGADVNADIAGQLPALHSAAISGNVDAVRLLLEYKADVCLKARRRGNRTALYYAIIYAVAAEHYEICKLLLENGASWEERDEYGNTLFLLAMQLNNLKVAQLLLDHGADSKAVDNNGATALHCAAMAGDIDLIRLALDQGIDIESCMYVDSTDLHYAALHGKPEACEFLIKHGAVVDKQSTVTAHTPLSLVLARPHHANDDEDMDIRMAQTLQVLLEHGAQITDKSQNRSRLEIAAVGSDNDHLKDLLMQHVAKMKYLDGKVDDHDLKIIESDECYKKCYQKHLRAIDAEVEMMERTKFYNHLPISILIRDKKAISGYARNEELVHALSDDAYNSKFPILFGTLKKRFYAEVEKHRLRRPALQILDEIFNFNDPLHPVIVKILSFLCDEDLKFLIM